MTDKQESINPDFYYEVGENMYLLKEKHINAVERIDHLLKVFRESFGTNSPEFDIDPESVDRIFDIIQSMCKFSSQLATCSEEEVGLFGAICKEFFKSVIANKDKTDYEINTFMAEHMMRLNYNAVTIWLLICGAIGFTVQEVYELVETGDGKEEAEEAVLIDIFQTKEHL